MGRSLTTTTIAVLVATAAAACGGGDDAARPITVVVSPHPDDEIQAWGALPADRRAGDVLLVFLTKGERTAYCDTTLPGLAEPLGERAPTPRPDASGTDVCKSARVASTVRFLQAMHRSDPSFPAVEAEPSSHVAGADVHEGEELPVLFFDLGDRELTTEQVRSAIETVVERRDELGLPSDRPFGDLVAASYANLGEDACFLYDHPDHLAVSEVVLHTDFEAFASQLVPVCSAAHDPAEHHPVDRATFDAAFTVDGERRVGAHTVEYGWLLDPYWVGDPSGQSQLFHRDQWFLRAFG